VKPLKGEMTMKQVIIEMINNEPVIRSKPRKIEVIILKEKKRGLKKRIKTGLHHLKSFLGLA
jgi:hypothetical protein